MNNEDFKIDSEGRKHIRIVDNLWILEEDYKKCNMNRQEEAWRYTHPSIYPFGIILNVFLALFFSFALTFITSFFVDKSFWFYFAEFFIILSFYIFVRLRDICIFIVRLYQRFAPTDIREECGFFPTCSDYMIIAIKKYGLIIGVIKGIKRIKRCHGQKEIDWP